MSRTLPLAGAYAAAVQNPGFCFTDETLRGSVIQKNNLGQPRAMSGQFSVVFPMVSPDGGRYAVKCFTHDAPNQLRRYDLIYAGLTRLQPRWATDFIYQPDGIRVEGETFPVLRLDWVEGVSLMAWLETHRTRADIRRLAEEFDRLVRELAAAGVGHGDLQHGNILVQADGSLRLIDYDAIYLPGMGLEEYPSDEIGLPGYQPPDRTAADYGPDMDRFSAWLISLSLRALAADPSLLGALNPQRGEYLLLDRDDFADPWFSARMRLLEAHADPRIRDLADRVRILLTLPLSEMPDPAAPWSYDGPVPERPPRPRPRAESRPRPVNPEWMAAARLTTPSAPSQQPVSSRSGGSGQGAAAVAGVFVMVMMLVGGIIILASHHSPRRYGPAPRATKQLEPTPAGLAFPLSDGHVTDLGNDGSLNLGDGGDTLIWSADTRFTVFTTGTAPYEVPQMSGDCVTAFNGSGGAEITQAAAWRYHKLARVGYAAVDGARSAWSDGTIRDSCTGKILAAASPAALSSDPPECVTGSTVIRQQGTWSAPGGLRAWRNRKQLWQRLGRLNAVCDGEGTAAVLDSAYNTVDLIDPATGKPLWKSPGSVCVTRPGIPDECAYGPQEPANLAEIAGVVIFSGNGVVFAFDKKTGKPLWQQAGQCLLADRASPRPQALLGPCPHVSSTDTPSATVVNPETGAVARTLDIGSQGPCVANARILLIGSGDNYDELDW